MPTSQVQSDGDYTQTRAGAPSAVGLGWVFDDTRRWWTLPLITAGLCAAAWPFDAAILKGISGVKLGGDVRRELEAWQQFGAVGSIVFAGVVILLADPCRRRRVWDLAFSSGLTALVVWVIKMLVGRPRPKFDDPNHVLGPLGVYPVDPAKGLVIHAWEFWHRQAADLWSMPSNHTSAAAALATFLALVYPRLKWLGVAMVLLVAACRMMLSDAGSHYLTDTLVGACVGHLCAWWVAGRGVGVRVSEGLWPRPGRLQS